MLSAGEQRGFEAYVTQVDGTRYERGREGKLVVHHPITHLTTQKYAIHLDATAVVKRLNPRHDWIIAFRVDGRLILQLAHRKGIIGVECSKLHSEENGNIMEGQLMFAKIITTSDDEKVTLDHEVQAGLGDIRIDIYDGSYGREVAWKKPVLTKTDIGVAKESAVKRLGCTGISSKTPYKASSKSKGVDFVYNDPSKPFYSFVFNYRSKIALQVLRVIERDEPDPVPVKEERKRKRKGIIVIHNTDSESSGGEGGADGADSEDDIDRMEKRLAAMEAMLRKSNEEAKRERQRNGEPDDVVDITGGDSDDE